MSRALIFCCTKQKLNWDPSSNFLKIKDKIIAVSTESYPGVLGEQNWKLCCTQMDSPNQSSEFQLHTVIRYFIFSQDVQNDENKGFRSQERNIITVSQMTKSNPYVERFTCKAYCSSTGISLPHFSHCLAVSTENEGSLELNPDLFHCLRKGVIRKSLYFASLSNHWEFKDLFTWFDYSAPKQAHVRTARPNNEKYNKIRGEMLYKWITVCPAKPGSYKLLWELWMKLMPLLAWAFPTKKSCLLWILSSLPFPHLQ